MNWTVTIRPSAATDLNEAHRWYENQKVGLGSELLIEVRGAVQLLKEHPERYPIYYRGFRRILIRRFPYKLFFRIVESRVIVFRVMHVKRDHRSQFGD